MNVVLQLSICYGVICERYVHTNKIASEMSSSCAVTLIMYADYGLFSEQVCAQ